MDNIVPQPIEDYAAAHTHAPSSLLDELAVYTHAHCAMPQMLVGRLEGGLLKMLVHVSGARRILEIGLYTGYSALTMAEALPQEGTILSCDINKETAAIAQSFFDRSPHGRKIEIRLGPALQTLAALPLAPSFDLIFLDADKENYVRYYEAALPLLRPGGLLVADNVLWSGAVLNPQHASDHALAAFNDHVHRDPRVVHVVLTVRDGVMLAFKRA